MIRFIAVLLAGIVATGCLTAPEYKSQSESRLYDHGFIIELTTRCEEIILSPKIVKLKCADDTK